MIHTVFLFILAIFLSPCDETEIKVYATNARNNTTLLTSGSTIKLKGKPFSLKIEAYKESKLSVQLYCTFDKEIYDSLLQKPYLTDLDIFYANNTMAVPILSMSGPDKVLRIRNGSVQGYIHDSDTFTSFDNIGSTEKAILVTKEFHTFQDLSGLYFTDSESYKFKKAKRKTVYCILNCEAEIYKSGAYSVIPFTIEI